MLITDLSYLESVAENELVFGGEAVIGASASAWGDDTFTLTDTDLRLKTNKNGKSKLKGEATALSIGQQPIVGTYYDLDGFTKVKVKTTADDGEYFAYESITIKAKS